ncbi:hypothetical protein Fmac_013370 [Flemingia macrophylla]|uniref:Uncharacterized protein n=1 Tax=Flemingia macrophylla TaxID=520843 RepID=A0ABD1MSX9_9FABA
MKRLEEPWSGLSINFLLACYVIPYIGLTGLLGASPTLQNETYKVSELLGDEGKENRHEISAGIEQEARISLFSSVIVAGILGVKASKASIFRAFLFERRNFVVNPYRVTMAEFTNRISDLRHRLGREGIKDEGLVVPPWEGAEGKVSVEILRIIYARVPDASTLKEQMIVFPNLALKQHKPYLPSGLDLMRWKDKWTSLNVAKRVARSVVSPTQLREWPKLCMQVSQSKSRNGHPPYLAVKTARHVTTGVAVNVARPVVTCLAILTARHGGRPTHPFRHPNCQACLADGPARLVSRVHVSQDTQLGLEWTRGASCDTDVAFSRPRLRDTQFCWHFCVSSHQPVSLHVSCCLS